MLPPLYVGYYTRGTPYAEEARELAATCCAFGLSLELTAIDDLGGWQRNTQAKAAYLLDRWYAHASEGRGLVYLDADARVRKYPALFDHLDCDFAAHWREGYEMISACMYLGTTAVVESLLLAWVDECALRPNDWDQKCLQDIVERRADLRVVRLPPEYNAIFDAGMCPESEWVISQHQASRRYKKIVGA